MRRVLLPLGLLLMSAVVSAEEAVIAVFPFAPAIGDTQSLNPLFELEDQLNTVLLHHHSGELDGNEVGNGIAVIYMYGASALRLYESVKPVLANSQIITEGYVRVRFGPPGSTEVRYSIK